MGLWSFTAAAYQVNAFEVEFLLRVLMFYLYCPPTIADTHITYIHTYNWTARRWFLCTSSCYRLVRYICWSTPVYSQIPRDFDTLHVPVCEKVE